MKVLRKTFGTVREEVSGEQGSSTARRATIITVHQILLRQSDQGGYDG
jgi:hypothetical protein